MGLFYYICIIKKKQLYGDVRGNGEHDFRAEQAAAQDH
jgi:hypothetical protein